ncbi:TAT-variant-translocated molybdopterin oxidoreductase [Stieleria sp. ICT_E10.1]|uniref:TAT-variant-translocated molybdopterin oxidoreductase n=1 Tax=Stieleria sedimenti TaxID=2976331 RepID=UPI00218062BB|nr:TAT-variant-translocated molybdopterin oxidoreductase [Stieleria sedimenti]MCS7465882.1 TAT-variant-translocated molybdopterin oxidoreductase [Stieleria sedimenti]
MSPIKPQPMPDGSCGSKHSDPGHRDPEHSGQQYYRSIEHLAGSPAVTEYIEQEFPSLSQAIGTTDRRQFLRLLGASMALAGLTGTGCRRWPVEEVRPHTSRPEGYTPGVAQHYATSIELEGVSTGILAKSYDGRPIKIEGNPDHPYSRGAASAFSQASVLELYDPDRSRSPWLRRRPTAKAADASANGSQSTWQQFQNFATPHFQALRNRLGDGLAILIQPTASPTFARLRSKFEAAYPKARWFEYQPLHRDHEFAGSRAALGRVLRPQYDLQQASTTVTFDADLLGSHPASLRHARDWSSGRRSVDSGSMNRLYAVEPGLTITGSVADVRLPMKPTLVQQAIAYVAYRLGVLSAEPGGLSEEQIAVLENAARELEQAGTAGLVVAGPAQNAASHQLVHAINHTIGSVGHAVSYTEEPLARAEGSIEQIATLSELLQGNVLNTLVIIGGNPVYDAPADTPLNLVSDEARPLTSIHLSLHDDETSKACTWHLPMAHFLESWGDGRAWDGSYTLQQPLILPLYDGKSPIELLAMLSGQSPAKSMNLVRSTFDKQFDGATQQDWERALHAGVRADSAFTTVDPPAAKVDSTDVPAPNDAPLEIRFVPDLKTHDGRFANNAWLQELPEPLTKMTWDNAAMISPADAKSLGLEMGDVVKLSSSDRGTSIEVPVCILPGHARGCITLPLGYGRTAAGHIGNQVGVNVYPLRSKQSSYLASDCELTKTGETHELVSTQVHDVLDAVAESAKLKRLGERGTPGMIVHETLFAEYQHDHHAVHGDAHAVHAAPLFDLPHKFDSPHRWGMSIDLNACIGCSGCVVACQAENNIPVVGKANVAVNREMHWLRIDRYYKGDIESPDVVHQPMACAHCENAPCEQVCPVAATVHDSEGLNAMVYNRCIGTRYCANNCPFKVRRFNYFDYQASDPRTPAKPWVGLPDQQQIKDVSTLKKMVHNPEVSVRMRGVMEKCTYCVQRIVDARIHAKNEHSQGLRESDLVAEGEVQTACQATCPTQAIVFGDLNDPESAVSKAKKNARSYQVLEGNNLGARTTYLAKIRNRES